MLLLRLALRPWKLAPFSQFFSALAVGLLLLMAGFLFWIQTGLRPVLKRLQHEQVITAFIDPAAEASEESQIVDSIRASIGSQAITELKLVDAKDFVSSMKTRYPDLGRELEDLGGEMVSVVPRYVSIAGIFSDSTLTSIREVHGIESADSSKDRYQSVVAAFSALRWVARLLVLGLAAALTTGLIHLSRMNSYLHRDAVSLMGHWGASASLLRMPGLVSGLTVGLAGGIFAAMGWLTSSLWLVGHIQSLSPLLRDMPLLSSAFALVLIGMGAVVGLAAGFFGTPEISERRI